MMVSAKKTRFVIPAKQTKTNDELAIIIPAAGAGYRMKSHGPKCLLKFRESNILNRQIGSIRGYYPNAEIIVVVGFQADSVYREIRSDNIRFVENERYEETNVAHSISLGVRAATEDNLIIIYGDLLFNNVTIKNLVHDTSCAVVDSTGHMDGDEIGLTITDDEFISHFAYSLTTKWGQILYINYRDRETFKNIVCDRSNEKLFGFEILNELLDNDIRIKAIGHPQSIIVDIDDIKDLEKAIRIKEL